MTKVGILHPNLEKYRSLLDMQYELAEIYNKNKRVYKYKKQLEEKRRYKEALKRYKEGLKIKSLLKINATHENLL